MVLVAAFLIAMFTFAAPTVSADPEWWDVTSYPTATYTQNPSGLNINSNFAGKRTFNVTVAGRTVSMTHYWGWYVERPNFAAQRINIYVPAGADETTPIFFITNNSGWNTNTYPNTISANASFAANADNRNALAMERGHILVSYGSRDRSNAANAGDRKSPSTVNDAKAAIRFVKHNIIEGTLPGNPDRIYTSGDSGGGGLTTALAASGNHPDYYPFLHEIGALGITKVGDEFINSGDDSVFATLSWYPMLYMGGGDYAYEWDYYTTRQAMYDGLYPGHPRTSTAYMGNTSGPNGWYPWQLAYSRALHNAFPAYALAFDGVSSVDDVADALTDLVEASLNRHIVNPYGTRNLATQLRAGTGTAATTWTGLPMDWYVVENNVASVTSIDGFKAYSAHRSQYFKQIGMQANMQVNGGDNGVEGMYGARTEHTAPVHALAYAMATPRWGGSTGWTQGIVDWGSYNTAWNTNLNAGGPTGNSRPTAAASVAFMNWSNTQKLAILAAIEDGTLDPYVEWNKFPTKDIVELQTKTSNTLFYLLNDEDIALADTAPYWFVRTGLHDDGTAFSSYALLELGLRYSPKVLSHDHQLIVGMGHAHMTGDNREGFAWLDAVFAEVDKVPVSLAVTTLPDKTVYNYGEALDFTGMVVTVTYDNGTTQDVTNFSASPGNGSVLNTIGDVNVLIGYTEKGVHVVYWGLWFEYKALPVSSLVITGAGGVPVPALVTLPRNSSVEFGLDLNVGSLPTGVVWSVSNPALATVDADGKVTAKTTTGTLVLTAKDADTGVFQSITLRII